MKKFFNYQKLLGNSRGDTIVEVLIAISIISVILVGGFVATNVSLSAERQAQDRGVALQVLKSQLEILHSAVLSDSLKDNNGTAINLSSMPQDTAHYFCLNGSSVEYYSAPSPSGPGNCFFDSSNTWSPTPSSNEKYQVYIRPASGSLNWDRVKVSATWSQSGGSGTESENLYYNFYPHVLSNNIPTGSYSSGSTGTGSSVGTSTCSTGSNVLVYNAGSYTFTPPAGTTCVKFVVEGANGADYYQNFGWWQYTYGGGLGGKVSESFQLTAGTSYSFDISVASPLNNNTISGGVSASGAGGNGGGYAGGGGGMSSVSFGGSYLLVAGGGGGFGYDGVGWIGPVIMLGGNAGPTGVKGEGFGYDGGGLGGTNSTAGAGGGSTSTQYCTPGQSGQLTIGGNGASHWGTVGGGGGGGGYYAGGGGGDCGYMYDQYGAGAGGGGANYITPTSDPSAINGVKSVADQSGGKVDIYY